MKTPLVLVGSLLASLFLGPGVAAGAPDACWSSPRPKGWGEALALTRARYDEDAARATGTLLAAGLDAPWATRAVALSIGPQLATGHCKQALERARDLLARKNLRPGVDIAVRLGAARAALACGDPADALKWLDPIERHLPDGIVVPGLWALRARAHTAAGHLRKAARAWKKAAKLPLRFRGVDRAEALYQRANVLEKLGDIDGATSARRKLLVAWPESDAAQRLVAEGKAPKLGQALAWKRAMALWKRREAELALEALAPFLNDPDKGAKAHWMTGSIYSVRLRTHYDLAVAHLAQAVAGLHGDDAGLAAYDLALARGKASGPLDAVSALQAWLRAHRHHPKRAEVLFEVGRHLMEAGQFDRAGAYFWRTFNDYPKGNTRTTFLWFSAWAYLRAGKPRRALPVLDELAKRRHTLVGDKARYWKGVAMLRLGHPRAAYELWRDTMEKFPYSYYAWLAERALREAGQTVSSAPAQSLPGPVQAPALSRADASTRAAACLVRDLSELGLVRTARQVWKRHARSIRRAAGAHADELDAFAAVLLGLYKAPRQAVYKKWAWVLLHEPKGVRLDWWRRIFPLAFSDLARVVADHEGVPVWQLYAHMLQESRYDPDMVSGAGAWGLVQVLPATARRVARDAHIRWTGPQDLFDEAFCLRLGASYLAALRKRYGGQAPLAIAAYNGGPLLVDWYLERYPGLDMASFIESLPPHQTRNYTRKILEHVHRYVAIYAGDPARRKLMDDLLPKGLDYHHGDTPSY